MNDLPHTKVLRKGERPLAIEFSRFELRVVDGADAGTTHTSEQRSVRIGSSPSCGLVLKDTAVSKVHCEVLVDESGYLLRDAGSTNGTWVNGLQTQGVYLAPHTQFRVGNTKIEFVPQAQRVEVRLSEADAFGEVLGRSVPMRAIFYMLERVATKDVTILLTGETGTGKEVFARSIHQLSHRAEESFITVDCGALAPSLIGSELFGHVKGAFTGANADRSGAFEDASGGTVFLDEIGELPPEQQTSLLRVLENGEIKRLGENKTRTVDVRIIAATNRNLAEEVEAGNFRKDLFFRLNVFNLEIPPLRERRDDIELLATHILSRLAAREKKEPPELDPDAMQILLSHSWPGNVRELHNVLERSYAISEQRTIDAASITVGSQSLDPATQAGTGDFPIDVSLSYYDAKEALEKVYLMELLNANDGNVSKAARVIGIHRQSLHRLLRKHGIRSKD